VQGLENIVRGSLGPISSADSKPSDDAAETSGGKSTGAGMGGQVRRAIKDIIPG